MLPDVLVRLILHVAFLRSGHFLGENAEKEISFLIGLEGAQHKHIASWLKVKTLEDLASVGETARGVLRAVVQDVLCVNRVLALRNLCRWRQGRLRRRGGGREKREEGEEEEKDGAWRGEEEGREMERGGGRKEACRQVEGRRREEEDVRRITKQG